MAKITKEIAQVMLADVPEEKRFWCHDGRYFKNLDELKDGLEQISDEVYGHHANAEKTDFSNWVKDVIGDEKLSNDLLKCATRADAITVVSARIKFLKSKVK